MANTLLDLPLEMRYWILYYADMPLKVCHVDLADTANHFDLTYDYIPQNDLLFVNRQIYAEVSAERDRVPFENIIQHLDELPEELDVLYLSGTAENWTGAAALWCKESLFVVRYGGISFLKTMINENKEGLITKLILSAKGLQESGYDERQLYDSTDTDVDSLIDDEYFLDENLNDPDILDNYYGHRYEDYYEDNLDEEADDEPAEPEEEESDNDGSDFSADSDDSSSLFWADWSVLRSRLLLHPLSSVYLLLDNERATQLPWRLLELLREGRIPAFSLLYRRHPDDSVPEGLTAIFDALGANSLDAEVFEAWYATSSRSLQVSTEVAPVGRCFFGVLGAEVMVTFRLK